MQDKDLLKALMSRSGSSFQGNFLKKLRALLAALRLRHFTLTNRPTGENFEQ
jgi:hypothetical protein